MIIDRFDFSCSKIDKEKPDLPNGMFYLLRKMRGWRWSPIFIA